MQHDFEDERDITEVPPSEPAGSAPVSFSVPVPRIEQVTGEIARQLIAAQGYSGSATVTRAVGEALDAAIEKLIAEKAAPALAAMLEKPLQPTDGFGNPIGEPTSLHGYIAKQIDLWGGQTTDGHGKKQKRDGYNASYTKTRIEWALEEMVNHELKSAVDKEVRRIVGELRGKAAQQIAAQIASSVAGYLVKQP